MWQVGEKNLENYCERKTTEKRTSKVAHLNDIVKALVKLDNEDKLPIFVARNIENLPDRQPEELNMISIINRLTKVENNIRQNEEVLSSHEIDLHHLTLFPIR